MIFKKLNDSHVKEVVSLVLENYKQESIFNSLKSCTSLKGINSLKTLTLPELKGNLLALFEQRLIQDINSLCKPESTEICNGLAAFTEKGTLAGFLYFPWTNIDGFFGLCKGAYSPLFANAYRDTSNEKDGMSVSKVASILFEKVSTSLAKQQISSYALTVFAHNKEVIDSFVFNGFGIRCADAIKKITTDNSTKLIKTNNDFTTCDGQKISFRLITANEFLSFLNSDVNNKLTDTFYDLWVKLGDHLENSPTFMSRWPPKKEEFINSIKERNSDFYSAFVDEEPIGYIQLFSGGENWISETLCEQKLMRHICGTYVLEEYRTIIARDKNGQIIELKLADQILIFILQELQTKAIPYLGVDCETLNPTALRFWGKHFDNYTYSLHRRIDERCFYKENN